MIVIAGLGVVASGGGSPSVVLDTEPAGEPTFPDVAAIRCDESGTTLLTSAVVPQADGVHIRIENPTNTHFGLDIERLGGDNAPPGSSEIVWAIPPGRTLLRCVSIDAQEIPPLDEDPDSQPLNVIDEMGLWTDYRLECASGNATGGTGSSSSSAQARKGDLLDVAAQDWEYLLRDGDTVQLVGYPQAAERVVSLGRDTKTIALNHYRGDEEHGWWQDSSEVCEGS